MLPVYAEKHMVLLVKQYCIVNLTQIQVKNTVLDVYNTVQLVSKC